MDEVQKWKSTCSKLLKMMLPYSLLMNETEKEELKTILEEISLDSH
jgi:hypothetical protein